MSEEQISPGWSSRTWRLIGAATAVTLLILVLVIESCDTEKVQVCDTTTGECELESSCRPLLFDLLR